MVGAFFLTERKTFRENKPKEEGVTLKEEIENQNDPSN